MSNFIPGFHGPCQHAIMTAFKLSGMSAAPVAHVDPRKLMKPELVDAYRMGHADAGESAVRIMKHRITTFLDETRAHEDALLAGGMDSLHVQRTRTLSDSIRVIMDEAPGKPLTDEALLAEAKRITDEVVTAIGTHARGTVYSALHEIATWARDGKRADPPAPVGADEVPW